MSLSFLCELSIGVTVGMVILLVILSILNRDNDNEAQKGDTIYLEVKV